MSGVNGLPSGQARGGASPLAPRQAARGPPSKPPDQGAGGRADFLQKPFRRGKCRWYTIGGMLDAERQFQPFSERRLLACARGGAAITSIIGAMPGWPRGTLTMVQRIGIGTAVLAPPVCIHPSVIASSIPPVLGKLYPKPAEASTVKRGRHRRYKPKGNLL